MPPNTRRRPVTQEHVTTPERPAASIVEAAPSQLVRVRARTALAETVSGVFKRFEPGEEFTADAARAMALGPLVEIVSRPAA